MLQYFDEDTEEQPLTTTCCDICNYSVEKDFSAEINVIIQTIAEFSDIGEKKVNIYFLFILGVLV